MAKRNPGKSVALVAETALTETQQRILAAALEVFSEKGFSGASTAEIAVRAGVAEKTIFANFKSKERLLTRTLTPAVLTLIEPQMISGLQATLDQRFPTLASFLTAFLTNRLAIVGRHPHMLKLLAHEAVLRPDFVHAIAETFRTQVAPHLAPAIADLVARGELRPMAPHTLLRTVISVTLGYALSRYVLGFEGEADDAEEIARIVDVLVGGLGPDVPRAEGLPMPKRAAR